MATPPIVPVPVGAGAAPPVIPPGPPAGGGAAVPPAGGHLEWPAEGPDHQWMLGYFKWSTIIIGGFLLPTAIAAILNGFGWKGGIAVEIALIGLGFFLLVPAVIGGSGLVDFLGRLKWIFKKPGDDATPAEKERWGRVNQAFNALVITAITAVIGPAYLLFVDIKGFGDYALLLVAFIPFAVLYVLNWVRSATFIRAVGKYALYGVVTIAIAWPIAQMFPGPIQAAKSLWNNRLAGPFMSWISREATTSAPGQLARAIEDAVIKSNTGKVTTCLEALKLKADQGVNVTPDDIAKCHSLDKNPFKGAGSATGGGATSSTAAAATATTSQVGKRIQYAPHQVTGAISLGDYAAGNYRIMGEGKRYQRFGSANWEMDAFGRVTAEGGNTYPAPSSAPLAGPNGMLVARSGGQVHKVDSCFRHPGGRIHGDLNVAPGDYVGSGSIEVWVEGC